MTLENKWPIVRFSPDLDRNGPTAVIKSVSKLPTHRLPAGGPMNLRLSPQMVATDRDIDNFGVLPVSMCGPKLLWVHGYGTGCSMNGQFFGESLMI